MSLEPLMLLRIPVASPRDGLELVDALKREGVRAMLVAEAGRTEVRIVATRERVPGLLRESARLLESSATVAPLEAA